MAIDLNGINKGVIGKKLPSDTTLNNMKKADLIKLLHIAEHNHEILAFFYGNAVKRNQENVPIPQWIPCSERLPEVEIEVLIVAKRKYRNGTYMYITTTAIYENGTILEKDSCWYWEDIEGEWSEEDDCYIIPGGWWEFKHYNGDGELNHAVDDEVIAWMPLPKPYEEEHKGCDT